VALRSAFDAAFVAKLATGHVLGAAQGAGSGVDSRGGGRVARLSPPIGQAYGVSSPTIVNLVAIRAHRKAAVEKI
jgi:hypothetical protein